MPDFQSPGDAFSSGVESFLMQRAAQARQKMLDGLTQRREMLAEQHDAEQNTIARDRLTHEQKRLDFDMEDKSRKEFAASVPDRYRMGDFASTDDLAKQKKYGLDLFVEQTPGSGTFIYPGGAKERDNHRKVQEGNAIIERMYLMDRGSRDFDKAAAQLDVLGVKLPPSLIAPVKTPPDPLQLHKDERMFDITHPLPVHEPREPNPQPQMLQGPDGKMHAVQFINGAAREIPLPEGYTKPTPTERTTAANKKTGLEAVSHLEQDIADASDAGLLGPGAGRYYSAMAKLGTTGDKSKDRLIGRLKTGILLMKMHIDAGIGGARAAASPLLLKAWDDLAMSSSKDLLDGYLSSIREDLGGGGSTTSSSTSPKMTPADAWKKYGK